MSKQTRRSVFELLALAVVLVVFVVKFGFGIGVPAAVGVMFAYGLVSVLMKFGRIKKLALKSATRLASSD